MSAFPSLKLVYFNAAGRAEATRLALYLGGIPFQDERVSYQAFGALRSNLPYAQLPVLEVNGEVMAQSRAILGYAGRLAKLYPSHDALLALRVDEVLGALEELLDKIVPSLRESNADKKLAMRRELAEVTIPRYLRLIEARLDKLEPQLPASQLFIHHLSIYSFVEWMKGGHLDHVPATVTDGYAQWNRIHSIVKEHPKVMEWYAMRKRNADPKLKLTYFPRAGRAEPIRLAFHIGGVAFEDERISPEELQVRKPSLPFNQLPVLEINGELLAQSLPILRYAGTLSGLYPVADPVMAFRIDELFGAIDELHNVWGPSFRETDEAKRMVMRKELADITIPKFLSTMNARIGLWNESYAVSSELTVADLALYGLVNGLRSGHMIGVPTTIVDPFEHIVRVVDRVLQHPKVVEWYETHEH